MSEVSQIRNSIRRKKKLATIRRIAVVIVLLALAAALFINREKLTAESISQWLSGSITNSDSKEGFPVKLPSGEMVSLLSTQNNIVLTTQTNTYFYSARGKLLRNSQHSCKNAQSKAAGKNLLVYSVGSGEALVETSAKTTASLELQNRITTAEICQNGRFAIATESDVYTSEMIVYDKNANPVFKWTPSGSVITSLALSQDGKTVAAATVQTEDGVLVSGIHLFETGKSEAVFSYKLKDEMVLSLSVLKRSVVVVTQKKVIEINSSGEVEGEFDFNGKTLIDVNHIENATALVFKDANDPGISNLVVLGNKCVVSAEASVSDAVTDMAACDDKIYLLTDKTILEFSKSTAVKIGQGKIEHGGEILAASPSGAFVITSASELIRADIK